MDRRKFGGRVAAMLALAAMLSACTPEGLQQTGFFGQAGGLPDVAADRVMPADTPRMRVLRVEVFLAVVSYAGLKRIEGSLNTAKTNSQAFLLRVKEVQAKIEAAGAVGKAEEAVDEETKRAVPPPIARDSNLWLAKPFEIRMNEVVEELVELTKAAVEIDNNAVSLFSGLASASTVDKLRIIFRLIKDAARIARRGRAVLTDVATLEHKLIADLKLACAKKAEDGTCEAYDWSKAKPQQKHWDYVLDMLKFSCDFLGKYAEIPDANNVHCKLKGGAPI